MIGNVQKKVGRSIFFVKKVYKLGKHLKRQHIEWKHKDPPVKKTFRVQRFVKKVMLTVLQVMKRPTTYKTYYNPVTNPRSKIQLRY